MLHHAGLPCRLASPARAQASCHCPAASRLVTSLRFTPHDLPACAPTLPACRPPELVTAGTVSTAADVYSFAVILLEMYTGKRAWLGMTFMQILSAISAGGWVAGWLDGCGWVRACVRVPSTQVREVVTTCMCELVVRRVGA